jgi:hypothetical protein
MTDTAVTLPDTSRAQSSRAKGQRREITGARRGACASILSATYGWKTGAKPDGGVADQPGAAVAVSGTVGGVVVVADCPVYSGTAGRATCSGLAEPTSPKIPPSTPMATTALTPIVADPNFHCLPCTLTTPIREWFAAATGEP